MLKRQVILMIVGAAVAAGAVVATSPAPSVQSGAVPAPQALTDEYVRYELLAPATSSYKVTYDVSATTTAATIFVYPIGRGTDVKSIAVRDLTTGAPLTFVLSGTSINITLARPVPARGQARLRIEKTVQDKDAYRPGGDPSGPGAVVFAPTFWGFPSEVVAPRGSLVLPAGYELIGCTLPVQVLSESDGRIAISYANQNPRPAMLTVTLRAGSHTGPAAAPKPLTNARSWEPPGQGATERARLTERARQDRDIVYFLQQPSTNAFSLYHDYTESRPGTSTYLNVVRTGARVSSPSAYILDTGEVLKHETLKGEAITAAKVDIGGVVTPETEVVVIHFPPVKEGQSIRLRISETYTTPQSYRLDGEDLVFERSLGRMRNAVVLPDGWYLTASAIPGIVSETPDGRIRIDFMTGRPNSDDVYIKGRHR